MKVGRGGGSLEFRKLVCWTYRCVFHVGRCETPEQLWLEQRESGLARASVLVQTNKIFSAVQHEFVKVIFLNWSWGEAVCHCLWRATVQPPAAFISTFRFMLKSFTPVTVKRLFSDHLWWSHPFFDGCCVCPQGTDLEILKQSSRLVHYCATPLLFDPVFRKQIQEEQIVQPPAKVFLRILCLFSILETYLTSWYPRINDPSLWLWSYRGVYYGMMYFRDPEAWCN